jgi:hypothetical protein
MYSNTKYIVRRFHLPIRYYWTPKNIYSSTSNIPYLLSNQQNVKDIVIHYKCSIRNPNIINPENSQLNSIYEVEINYIKDNVSLKKSYTTNHFDPLKKEITKFINDNSIPITINKFPLDL